MPTVVREMAELGPHVRPDEVHRIPEAIESALRRGLLELFDENVLGGVGDALLDHRARELLDVGAELESRELLDRGVTLLRDLAKGGRCVREDFGDLGVGDLFHGLQLTFSAIFSRMARAAAVLTDCALPILGSAFEVSSNAT